MALAPISPDTPCGDDTFDNISGLLDKLASAGMGEESMSAVEGEKRDSSGPTGMAAWRELDGMVLEAFGETKHLELVWYLLVAQAHLRGLGGLTDGLDVINNLLGNFWEQVYPTEPEDDHEYRRLALDRLGEQAVLAAVDEVRVVEGRQTGAFTLGDFRKSHDGKGADTKLIEQGFAETVKDKPTYYDDLAVQANETRGAIARLEESVAERFSSYQVPLGPLKKRLGELEAAISGFSGVPLMESVQGGQGAGAPGGGGPAPKAADALNSREDVVRVLAKIIQFYQKNEPTSPVPILLERAQRVATMDFKEIVKEFNLSGSPSIQEVLGWKDDF